MTAPQPDGTPRVLEVDRVEWVPGARGALEVRVFGSWRGAAPTGLAFLLVDDERHRHMFPALASPPTSRPGQWSAAFPVPGELRPLLTGPLAMRVGIDEVVLPPAQAGATQEPETAEVVDRAVLAERRARRAELVEAELTRRAEEAERTSAALEAQLRGLEERLHEVIAQRDAAQAQLHERDRALLTSNQREHAERALREEAEEERHQLERTLGAELADARARLAEAEERAEEADQLRARVAEADDLRQRMLAAREERRGLLERLGAAEGERDELAERLAEVEAQRDGLAERVAGLDARSAPASGALTLVQTPGDEEPASTDAGDRAPAPAATTPGPASVDPSVDPAGTLRRELAEERARREQEFAALRGELTTAVEGLRAELAALAARGIAVVGPAQADSPGEAAQPADEPPTGPPVDRAQSAQLRALAEELERARPRRAASPDAEGLVADLGAAARRLRENGHANGKQAQPSAQAPASQSTAFPTRVVPDGDRYEDEWLAESVEAIAADDTALAAQIVTALLPAQRHLVNRPLRYDLALEGAGTLRVELGGGEASVEPRSQPAPGADAVDFRVGGPVRAVARLATGSARRRLRGARVEGSRWRLWRLLRALRAPLSLAALARGGERLDPGLVFTLLARAVDRRWTDDHPLAVTYRVTGDHEAVWHVATTGGAPLTVTEGAPDEVPEKLCHAVVEVPAHAFLPVVAREPLPDDATATVTGDPAAVTRLHAWFDRVQGLPIEG